MPEPRPGRRRESETGLLKGDRLCLIAALERIIDKLHLPAALDDQPQFNAAETGDAVLQPQGILLHLDFAGQVAEPVDNLAGGDEFNLRSGKREPVRAMQLFLSRQGRERGSHPAVGYGDVNLIEVALDLS